MGVIRHVLKDRVDNWIAAGLIAAFFVFYAGMGAPYVAYMRDHAEQLLKLSPFYGAPFTLNLFNFDPTLYYGSGNTSFIHPFLNLLSGPLPRAAAALGGNALFLVLQSLMNACGAALLYVYIRRSGADRVLAGMFAVWFGVGSYNLFTALIPDSYPYVQFIILLSMLALQADRAGGDRAVGAMKHGGWLLANFALTSTNVLTYAGALLVNRGYPLRKGNLIRFAAAGGCALLLLAGLTLVQYMLFDGHSWIVGWSNSLQSGGFSYVAPFSLALHAGVYFLMVINPVLTPQVGLMDPGLVAFTTNMSVAFPLHVSLVGLVLTALAVAGLVRGYRSPETWTLAIYIGFAAVLHLAIGFGLAAYQYDMYLYAAHYLFAFYLLAARFMAQLGSRGWRRTLMVVVACCVVVTLANNIVRHVQTLDVVAEGYERLK